MHQSLRPGSWQEPSQFLLYLELSSRWGHTSSWKCKKTPAPHQTPLRKLTALSRPPSWWMFAAPTPRSLSGLELRTLQLITPPTSFHNSNPDYSNSLCLQLKSQLCRPTIHNLGLLTTHYCQVFSKFLIAPDGKGTERIPWGWYYLA